MPRSIPQYAAGRAASGVLWLDHAGGRAAPASASVVPEYG